MIYAIATLATTLAVANAQPWDVPFQAPTFINQPAPFQQWPWAPPQPNFPFGPYQPFPFPPVEVPTEAPVYVEPEICKVKEALKVSKIQTGVDNGRTVAFSRNLECNCDSYGQPVADTCRPESAIAAENYMFGFGSFECTVAQTWTWGGPLVLAGIEWNGSAQIKKNLACNCDAIGNINFASCLDPKVVAERKAAEEARQADFEALLAASTASPAAASP